MQNSPCAALSFSQQNFITRDFERFFFTVLLRIPSFVLLSVFSGVGGCGCPRSISVVLSGTASWVFIKSPPISASVAESMTFQMTFARTLYERPLICTRKNYTN